MNKKIKKVEKEASSLPSIGSEVIYMGILGETQKAAVVAYSNEFSSAFDNTILIRLENGKEKWVRHKQLKLISES